MAKTLTDKAKANLLMTTLLRRPGFRQKVMSDPTNWPPSQNIETPDIIPYSNYWNGSNSGMPDLINQIMRLIRG